jgi:hypothetical protein
MIFGQGYRVPNLMLCAENARLRVKFSAAFCEHNCNIPGLLAVLQRPNDAMSHIQWCYSVFWFLIAFSAAYLWYNVESPWLLASVYRKLACGPCRGKVPSCFGGPNYL